MTAKPMKAPICKRCKREVRAMRTVTRIVTDAETKEKTTTVNEFYVNHAIWPDGTGHHIGSCAAADEVIEGTA